MKKLNNYILEKLRINKDIKIKYPTLDISKVKVDMQLSPEEIFEIEEKIKTFPIKVSMRATKTGGVALGINGKEINITKPEYFNRECFQIAYKGFGNGSIPYILPSPHGVYKDKNGKIKFETIDDVMNNIVKYLKKKNIW